MISCRKYTILLLYFCPRVREVSVRIMFQRLGDRVAGEGQTNIIIIDLRRCRAGERASESLDDAQVSDSED